MPLPRNPTYWRIPATAVLALGVALGSHEGMRHVPYRDVNGVWTVCHGVTGPAVIQGHWYSDADCEQLESPYIAKMTAAMAQCLEVPLTVGEWVGLSDFTYNVGTYRFCHSGLVGVLNSGDHRGACARIGRYVYVGKRDCRIRSNNCPGIVKRRAWEQATCLRDL